MRKLSITLLVCLGLVLCLSWGLACFYRYQSLAPAVLLKSHPFTIEDVKTRQPFELRCYDDVRRKVSCDGFRVFFGDQSHSVEDFFTREGKSVPGIVELRWNSQGASSSDTLLIGTIERRILSRWPKDYERFKVLNWKSHFDPTSLNSSEYLFFPVEGEPGSDWDARVIALSTKSGKAQVRGEQGSWHRVPQNSSTTLKLQPRFRPMGYNDDIELPPLLRQSEESLFDIQKRLTSLANNQNFSVSINGVVRSLLLPRSTWVSGVNPCDLVGIHFSKEPYHISGERSRFQISAETVGEAVECLDSQHQALIDRVEEDDLGALWALRETWDLEMLSAFLNHLVLKDNGLVRLSPLAHFQSANASRSRGEKVAKPRTLFRYSAATFLLALGGFLVISLRARSRTSFEKTRNSLLGAVIALVLMIASGSLFLGLDWVLGKQRIESGAWSE